jgi:dipeptidyl aminopeptidase/acylaminoacyl peptidase
VRSGLHSIPLPTGAVLVALVALTTPRSAQDTTRVVVVDTTTTYKSDSLPLKPERTLAFDTDEGTWLSLDVSPDGRTIVFELLGDLYTLPITGGEATRITSGLPFDSQPRYAPDGKRLAFLSDRDGAENVWTCDADGSRPRQLADLIVLDKNPLADIHNTESIRWVMKNGRIFQGEDLTEIWPRKRPLPEQWWARWSPVAEPSR